MFSNDASEFVYMRTYSRWVDELSRRETWNETVDRYINFLVKHQGDKIPPKVIKKIRNYMLSFSVMPSMRAVWAAGPAAEQDNMTIFNCSFANIDSLESFSEMLYILMCGTGVGFSVSQLASIDKLPEVSKLTTESSQLLVVEDSRSGWANSTKTLLLSLYNGRDVEMDYSNIRPKGARLKTMGGRSSGPAPLIGLHNFIRELLAKAQGRKITSLEAHDLSCKIAEIVVVGGVRRSSLISLSDLNDSEMTNAKVFPFPLHRFMANNSAIYDKKPTAVEFLKEWASLAASGSGERGIFNLEGAKKNSPKRRNVELIQGVNPCGEILLRSKQVCNLSEVVVRSDDDVDTLLDKVETATWIGAIQSTFTYFPYLSKEWKENTEEERLLGVSLTGQMDNPEILTPDVLKALKKKAIKVAEHASKKLGINMPASITAVKPSGTVSQLVDSSSGIHTRYAQYYIRRYRIASTDPLFRMLKDQGVPFTPEVGQNEDTANTFVLEFPVKAPDGCLTRNDLTALEQLEHYKKIQVNWCEHNASATIYVKDSEWFDVGNWVYNNWDYINGVSFLPYDGGQYKLAPYEEIDKDKYEELLKMFPKIDYSMLSSYEMEDNTEGSQALACVSGICEI